MPFTLLEDGNKMLTFTYNAIKEAIYQLFMKRPALLTVLTKKCIDSSFEFDQEELETLNIEFHLIDEHGNVPDEIRLVVLHTVKENKKGG